MTKKIKHASEIPAWFKLDKYEFTQQLDAFGWYQQLAIRALCLNQADKFSNEKKPFPKKLQLAIHAIRENPNSDIIRDKKFSKAFAIQSIFPGLLDPFDVLDPQKQAPYLRGIYSVSIKDYLSARYLINEEKFAQAEKWFNSTPEEERLFNAPWMDNPLYTLYGEGYKEICDLLCIDLSRSDKFLIESFKKYLENRRKNQTTTVPITKYFQECDFKSWSRLGILPFLDISIFEYELIEKIPYRVLADAISPFGDKGEETIRKTIKPLATRLIKFTSLVQLSMQAVQKLAEENSA